jgi:hypothetical protein
LTEKGAEERPQKRESEKIFAAEPRNGRKKIIQLISRQKFKNFLEIGESPNLKII